jgi:hypothetical protein
MLHRAMLNDELDYPEPHEFKPECLLKMGKFNSSFRDFAFAGFGRRYIQVSLSFH